MAAHGRQSRPRTASDTVIDVEELLNSSEDLDGQSDAGEYHFVTTVIKKEEIDSDQEIEEPQFVVREEEHPAAVEESWEQSEYAARPKRSRKQRRLTMDSSEQVQLSLGAVICEECSEYVGFLDLDNTVGNSKYWDAIQAKLLEKYPVLKEEKTIRKKMQRSFWTLRRKANAKMAKGQTLTRHEEIAVKVPAKGQAHTEPRVQARKRASTPGPASGDVKRRKTLPNQPRKETKEKKAKSSAVREKQPVEQPDSVVRSVDEPKLDLKAILKKNNTAILQDLDFLFMVCKTVGPYAHRLKKINEPGVADNKNVWDNVEKDFYAKYPPFKGRDEMRKQLRAAWSKCKYQVLRRNGLSEAINRIVLEALAKSPVKSPTTTVNEPRPEEIQLPEPTPLTTKNSKARTSTARPTETPKPALEKTKKPVVVEREGSLEPAETESSPNTPRETSIAFLQPGAKTVPVATLLKVIEFCKRTNHAFHLEEDEMVFTDRDTPTNVLRFPIDRLDHFA